MGEFVAYDIEIVNNVDQLAQLTAEAIRRVLSQAAHMGALMVITEARRSILQDPKTGRLYQIGRRNGAPVFHRASAPGETPANRTGRLVSSLIATAAEERDGVIYAKAIASAAICQYAVSLEDGMTVAQRPFMSVSGYKVKPQILQMVEQMVKKAVSHV